MKRISLCIVLIVLFSTIQSQSNLTPEKLWQLGRVSGMGLSKDKQFVIYSVNTPGIAENKSTRKYYKIPVAGGAAVEITNADDYLMNPKISSDGKYMISSDAVKLMDVKGSEKYGDLPKSNVYIYNSLNYRHWDTWEDGKYDHVFVAPLVNGKPTTSKDLMPNEPFDCPLKPFGGDEDFIWNPDGKHIVYVTKKKSGTAYALSTNTDLFEYNVETGNTKNLTETNKGYDLNPAFNNAGDLAWLQMKRDGFEADKQDLIVMNGKTAINLTQQRDDLHVESFVWAQDGKALFFIAPQKGTVQVFKVDIPVAFGKSPIITQLTKGQFEANGIIAQSGSNSLIISKLDMNHAAELFSLDLVTGALAQLTHVNDAMYQTIASCKTELRNVTTTDGLKMPTWVIYPPGFDPSKKYPTLLFCLGGPQGTTPHYSFRWNFQLMASQGYIVIAPDRRGVFGDGTKWTEGVSKDWGGQVIKDYLSAVDAISKESYVDKARIGCVGASFGGFSVFALEALHEGRFKTFISHDGVFDFKSMYGTTDEMFFENFEKGGPYWDKKNTIAQRSFSQSPSNFIDKWNTPILIIQGGKDYRVPIEQGQQAFQAAQLKGIKSRFLYIPDENHWVLSAQNALVWQREFYKWLDETLK